MFRGFRPASLPTATTRHRGRLSLIATIRQEGLGVSRDIVTIGTHGTAFGGKSRWEFLEDPSTPGTRYPSVRDSRGRIITHWAPIPAFNPGDWWTRAKSRLPADNLTTALVPYVADGGDNVGIGRCGMFAEPDGPTPHWSVFSVDGKHLTPCKTVTHWRPLPGPPRSKR